MSKNEKNLEIENRIEISLIIDDNHSTVIEIDLKRLTENTIENLCASICEKYDLNEKIQIKLMNQIKKEINDLKTSNKKEIEMGLVSRLYYESVNKGKEREKIIDKEKKEKEEKLLREFNFTPKINKSSNKIHDRKYMKIEDRLYYDYKKTSHKKGFEKFFDQLQMNKNSQNNLTDSKGKTMFKSSTNFYKPQSQYENRFINNSDDKLDSDVDDFNTKRNETKKFTFKSISTQNTRKNNFINLNCENQIVNSDENNNMKIEGNLNMNSHTNTNKNTNIKPDNKNTIINNLKKLSSLDKMEQTATFTNISENMNKNTNTNLNMNNNHNSDLMNTNITNHNVNYQLNINEIQNPSQVSNNNHSHLTPNPNIQNTQNNLKILKTQKAIILDNNNPTNSTGNNFLNTFTQLISNDNPSPKLDQAKQNIASNTEYDLYVRKNNFSKQFTFSNSNVASVNNERKGITQNNGNTYTEKYEKLIGKSLNTNSSKATPYVESLNENKNNILGNINQPEKDHRDVSNSPNNFVFTLNPNDKNNMKELFSNGNTDREIKNSVDNKNLADQINRNKEIAWINQNLISENFELKNEKAMTNLNKSSQTSDDKIDKNSVKHFNKTKEAQTNCNKSKEKYLSLTARTKSNTNKQSNNLNPIQTYRNKSREYNTKVINNNNSDKAMRQGNNRQNYSTWYDRLHKSKEDFREQKEEMIKKQIDKQCPFHPKISEVSNKIIKGSNSIENRRQFLERLSNSKRKTQVFKDSKLIFSCRSGNFNINTSNTLNTVNTFSLTRSKSLTSRKKNFNLNYENSISPTYASHLSKDIFSNKLEDKEKEKDISKRNYTSTVQSDNLESDNNYNSLGKIFMNTANYKCDSISLNKSKNLMNRENSKTEKSSRSAKKIRSLKADKNLVKMSYEYLENKQKANKLLQEKCNQSISKFKLNNLKELFEMIISGQDLNVLPNHIKEKLLIPVCSTMNERNLEFNFQNFYMTADEILNNVI